MVKNALMGVLNFFPKRFSKIDILRLGGVNGGALKTGCGVGEAAERSCRYESRL